MKNTKKILYILIFTLAFLLIGTVKSNAGTLQLNNLDFNAQINYDGSMDVTETWNIHIRQTNTLYKTFKTDSSKYSGITNVTVKDITNNQNINFLKNDKWEYHVDKNHYYGTKNDEGDFEIGWGVGLDNEDATRQYEISYTVKDAITKYNDYGELYWQFVGKDFEISASKITGIIYLPSRVSNKDDIKVWGHTQGLNGTIYATDTNKIEFELENFRNGRYVEIRALFPTELIINSGRTMNKEILQTAINEETKWADEANAIRKRNEFIEKFAPIIISAIVVIINIILIIVYVKKAIKYKKYLKTLNKYIPTSELKYYRDLPDENSTPGEAIKTTNINLSEFTPANFGKVFSATLLDLALKGHIEIIQDKNEKGKNDIKISIKKESTEQLKSDEEYILEFVKNATNNKEYITLKELQKYIQSHPTKVENLLKNTGTKIDNQLISEQILDKRQQEEYNKYRMKQFGYLFVTMFLFGFTLILFAIPEIIFIIDAVLCGKIAKRLNVLTQKGVDINEQWKGLKRYMEDFSMLDKREVPELVIWEKYLVYATAFGIADKVIEQLKMVYPNFDEVMTTNLSTYTYMNMMINTDFSKSFSNAISSSISSAYSSGSGSGGGFSGGGGFGRRPEAVEAGR